MPSGVPGVTCGADKNPDRPDGCGLSAGWGTNHKGTGRCRKHGGNTPTHVKSAVVAQAKQDVMLFGARRDIHPADALLELVQWTAGEVDYWRQRVRVLEEHELTWGVTRVKEGGDDRGTTEEAKPNVAYSMLVDASNRLERYSASALKAGVDERRVKLAEQQGTLIQGVLVAVLGELGHDVAPGSPAAQVILRHLAPLREMAEIESGGVA